MSETYISIIKQILSGDQNGINEGRADLTRTRERNMDLFIREMFQILSKDSADPQIKTFVVNHLVRLLESDKNSDDFWKIINQETADTVIKTFKELVSVK
mmetsp:Transcript_36595/g.32809  ORF Transcript_36595/g.32809 Transcript_36595/m.32809 type:complete len:100 (+) Transcript_36595:49-348(+)